MWRGAAARGRGEENHFVRRIRPPCYRHFAPPRVVTSRVTPVKRSDNVGSRYNTYFSGHLSGFAPGVPPVVSHVFISTSRDNMPPIDSQEGFFLFLLFVFIVCNCRDAPQSEIPRSTDDLFARNDKAAYASITAITGITVIEKSTRGNSLHETYNYI